MRHILIDRARRKQSHRHGAGWERLDVQDVEIAAPTDQETLLALDDALERLEQLDPAKAEVVKLRFFVGLSERETACPGLAIGSAGSPRMRWRARDRA